jgi:hypothetical protein
VRMEEVQWCLWCLSVMFCSHKVGYVLRLSSLKIGRGEGLHSNILTNLHATNIGNYISSQIHNFFNFSDN